MNPDRAGDAGDEVYAPDRAAWRRWLSEHASQGQGVWLIYDKGPGRTLAYDDIVEEALCRSSSRSLTRCNMH